MDFSRYLESLEADYHNRGISGTYISLSSSEGPPIDEFLLKWIADTDSAPVAVLAGYGKGKTTLSWYMTHRLIAQHRKDFTSRIPILMNLGDIATEQSIQGLLGKQLAADPLVKNYNFALFQNWNRTGRFAIILDGFDEMKHGLSVSQFRYNFSQILQLWHPKAKLLILGRPSIFQSDEERRYCLRGSRVTVSGKQYKETGWPTFREVEIADFSSAQLSFFLDQHFPPFAYRFSVETGRSVSDKWIDERLNAIKTSSNIEILGRPIHANMLCEVAADPETDISTLSLHALYDQFVERLMEREYQKPGRDKNIQPVSRLLFAKNLAWWMWRSHGLPSVLPDEIPVELVGRFAYEGMSYDLMALRRELVAGSFFEKDNKQALYFPHRSFFEFLVAEYLRLSDIDGFKFDENDKHLTGEVPKFLLQAASKADLAHWFHEYTARITTIQSNFSEFFASSLLHKLGREYARYDNGGQLWCLLRSFSIDPSWEKNINSYDRIVSKVFSSKDLTTVSSIDASTATIFVHFLWLLTEAVTLGVKSCDELVTRMFGLWLGLSSICPNQYLDEGGTNAEEFAKSANPIARALTNALFIYNEDPTIEGDDEVEGRGKAPTIPRSDIKKPSVGIKYVITVLTDALMPELDFRRYDWPSVARIITFNLYDIGNVAQGVPGIDRVRINRLLQMKRQLSSRKRAI
jgi:hypothetical protein